MAAVRPNPVERFELDPSHSQIAFVARHLAVTNVRGKFNKFSGHILLDAADITRSAVDVTIDAGSLDTDLPRRDTHLRSPDFFNVEKFPNITFKGTRVDKNANGLALIGDLTIRDVTRQVRIPFELSGPLLQQGRKRIGAEAVLRINRFDYGLHYNKLVEAAQVVGDSIRIELTVEAVAAPVTGQ